MKTQDKVPQNARSEQAVSKQATASPTSTSYWKSKVFRGTYTRDGKTYQTKQFYCQLQYAGARKKLGLTTNDRTEAAKRAAAIYKKVHLHGWDAALRELQPDKFKDGTSLTVGEFLEAALAVVPNARTVKGYRVALRWFVRRAFNIKGDNSKFDYKTGGREAWLKKIDRIQLKDLTPQKIDHVLAKFIADAGSDPVSQRRAKISAASMARQARSLFSKKMLKKLRFADVANPFTGLEIEGARASRYHGSMDAPELLKQAREELSENDPESYKVILLGLGAGLRRREIDFLQWQQVDAKQGVIRIITNEHFAPKTDDSENSVYVDAGLLAELEKFRDTESDLFVIKSKNKPHPNRERCKVAFDRVMKWLRANGVLAHKPLHTLRKEFGSLVNEASDIFTASRQLRHSNLQTTSQYYSDNRKRTAPVFDFLKEGAK